jgi:flagellar biosynthesis/type III secretory pathway M-ring protein FliF/YscJ
MELNNMLEKIKAHWNSWSKRTKIIAAVVTVAVILLII